MRFCKLALTTLICLTLGNSLSAVAYAQQSNFISTDTTLNSADPLTGGVIVGYASANDLNNGTNPTSPTVRLVSGGSVDSLLALNSSNINASGGMSGFLTASDSSIINVSGGSIGSLEVASNGTINLFGTGQITTLVTANNGGFSQYSLSGLLSDGTILINKVLLVQNGSNARVTLNNTPAAVPEPGSVALLTGMGVTGAGLLARRKRRAACPLA